MDFIRPKILVLLFCMVVSNRYAQSASSNFKNKTVIVSSILGAPYLMRIPDKNKQPLEGNSRFEGYIRDLLDKVSYRIGFKYEIKLVPDGRYGSMDASGEWNGIVGELINRKADIGAAGLTITSVRERVVDFTKPFMRTGITTLSKRPALRQTTRIFLFLEPFSVGVWIAMVISFLLVGIAICCFEKWLAPSGDDKSAGSLKQSSKLQTALVSLWGFWWAFRTVTWQGAGRAPKSCPARILSVFWMFMVACILCLYIASLVNWLPHAKTNQLPPIITVDELAKQTNIKYGTVRSGSTSQFFRTSKIPTYERMWIFMSTSQPSAFVDSVEEGVRRVIDGNYVFLGESTTFDYIEGQNCDLQSGDSLLDSKGYGLMTPLGSPLRDRLSLAVLEMIESGFLNILYNKWFLDTRMCGKMRQDSNVQQHYKKQPVNNNLYDVGGPFIILIGGFVMSLVAALIALIRMKCWSPQKESSDNIANTSTTEQQAVEEASRV